MPDINKTAIAKAIVLAKGQVGLRDRLRRRGFIISQQGISYWKVRGYAEPMYHNAIAQSVGQKVTVKELQKDIELWG